MYACMYMYIYMCPICIYIILYIYMCPMKGSIIPGGAPQSF